MIEISKDKIVNKRRPIGIKFPLTSDATSFFQQNFDTESQAKDNVFAFFNTKYGERVMRPNYGTQILNMIFEPEANSVETLSAIIQNEFSVFLPFAVYKDTEVFTDQKGENIEEINILWSLQGSDVLQQTLITL